MSLRGSPTDPTQKRDMPFSIWELTQEIKLNENRLFDITWSLCVEYLKGLLMFGAYILFNLVMIAGVFSVGEEWFGLSRRSTILWIPIIIIGITTFFIFERIAKELERRNLIVADIDALKERRRVVKYQIRFLEAELKRELQKSTKE